MIDIFMLSILVGLVQLGSIATIGPGVGAISFAAVVVITMFAAAAFDPRLMWDAAGENDERESDPLSHARTKTAGSGGKEPEIRPAGVSRRSGFCRSSPFSSRLGSVIPPWLKKDR